MLKWLLLVDRQPLPGSRNMAVDDFLLRKVEREEPLTVLRFYRWLRPTISLGFYQDISRVVNLEFCTAGGIDIVRRPTGGKLVLHDREVTYTVASSDAGVFTETLRDSYRRISLALVKGLELMGLKARLADSSPREYVRGSMPCFAFPARDEVEVGGRKIIGSAQKRTGRFFIQHGSIPLETQAGLLAGVSATNGGRAAADGPGMTSIGEALGRPVDFDWAVERLIRGFAETFDVAFEPYALGEGEAALVEELDRTRYAARDWTFLRRDASG